MKKYRFIGNMEDVTPCGSMNEECIAVGCKGYEKKRKRGKG